MQYKNIRRVHSGRYITTYHIAYETQNGHAKIYEMISRQPDMQTFDDLCHHAPEAVVLILHDAAGERLLLNHEYRPATGEWVYNFPAGLMEEGEEAEAAAKRELREETGLHLERIDEIWKESYSAVGFSNEKCVVVVGTAGGTIQPSDSETEEIEAGWFTRAEVRELLSRAMFAARTQAYCALWSRNPA